jgi:hypothetical protein
MIRPNPTSDWAAPQPPMAVMAMGRVVSQAVNIASRTKYGKPSDTLQNYWIPRLATSFLASDPGFNSAD